MLFVYAHVQTVNDAQTV